MSRIIGSECEYGIAVIPTDQDSEPGGWVCPNPDTLRDIYKAGIEQLRAQQGLVTAKYNGHLSNGGRLYIDCAAHPEYSTPETDLDNIAHVEMAGEDLVFDLLSAAKEQGVIKSFRLNKSCVDGRGTGWGYHENYLVERHEGGLNVGARWVNGLRSRVVESNLALVALHMATRQPYAGAGAVTRGRYGRVVFSLSQKATVLTDTIYDGTVQNKPLISLRDEPFADENRYVRLHVVGGDPHMSPKATEMTFGTTSLVLSMIRYGLLENMPFEYDPDKIHLLAGEIALDVSCKKVYTGSDGKTFRANDVQWEMLEKSHNLDDYCSLSAAEQRVRQDWETACTTIDKDPLQLKWADWTALYKILAKYHGPPADWRRSDSAFREETLSLWGRFTTIGTPGSVGERVREKAWAQDVRPELVERYKRYAPMGGRAAVRGAAIQTGLLSAADWDYVKVDGQMRRTLPVNMTRFAEIRSREAPCLPSNFTFTI